MHQHICAYSRLIQAGIKGISAQQYYQTEINVSCMDLMYIYPDIYPELYTKYCFLSMCSNKNRPLLIRTSQPEPFLQRKFALVLI